MWIFWVVAVTLASNGIATAADTIEVQAALKGAVQYLEQTQQKETRSIDYFSGEWPSTMMNAKTVPLIGKKGKSAYDSNNFTVSSIHNMLAAVWQRQPWLSKIPPMLDLSMDRILSYRNDEGFNFWPLLDPQHAPKPGHHPYQVRRPNHFSFNMRRVAAGCDVFNDADDTAVSFTAMKLYQAIRPGTSIDMPERIGYVFSQYRDLDRPFPHFYNLVHWTKDTGAFMTWLADEQPLKPRTYVPHPGKTYIPFGLNDVDCVVNANVLNALARYSELDTPGVNEACQFIEWAFKTGRQKTCGVYYPSPYNFHYVVAKAFDAGATCLKASLDAAVEEIMREQQPDGSWSSSIEGDDLHTSLYALNALLYAGDIEQRGTEQTVERGIEYALSQKQTRTEGAFAWPQGVFFSGGTVARNRMYWKSEPYTTALAADALSLYLQRYFHP